MHPQYAASTTDAVCCMRPIEYAASTTYAVCRRLHYMLHASTIVRCLYHMLHASNRVRCLHHRRRVPPPPHTPYAPSPASPSLPRPCIRRARQTPYAPPSPAPPSSHPRPTPRQTRLLLHVGVLPACHVLVLASWSHWPPSSLATVLLCRRLPASSRRGVPRSRSSSSVAARRGGRRAQGRPDAYAGTLARPSAHHDGPRPVADDHTLGRLGSSGVTGRAGRRPIPTPCPHGGRRPGAPPWCTPSALLLLLLPPLLLPPPLSSCRQPLLCGRARASAPRAPACWRTAPAPLPSSLSALPRPRRAAPRARRPRLQPARPSGHATRGRARARRPRMDRGRP